MTKRRNHTKTIINAENAQIAIKIVENNAKMKKSKQTQSKRVKTQKHDKTNSKKTTTNDIKTTKNNKTIKTTKIN